MEEICAEDGGGELETELAPEIAATVVKPTCYRRIFEAVFEHYERSTCSKFTLPGVNPL
jgi:hypothetical protein